MEVYIGSILTVAFSFAPEGFATCNGQITSIAQNTALFSLLGTTYGGNGQSTFALPNLAGQRSVGTGQSPAGSNYVIGQTGGTESVTLTQSQLPTHTHAATFANTGSSLMASSTAHGATVAPVANAVLGRGVDIATNPVAHPAIYAPAGSMTDTALAGLNVAGAVTVGSAGNSDAVSVLAPYLALTMIIALQGIYPSRP
jgi:microcystin-dependent protein